MNCENGRNGMIDGDEIKEKEIAFLMAAGLGSRMAPLTHCCPKPLVRVLGKPMIETMIEGLQARGLHRIVIIVGYKKEQFYYLKEKYNNVELVENDTYETHNNISSVLAIVDRLGEENCFICESDIYVADKQIFFAHLKSSCYFGKLVEGHSDDWLFDEKNGKIESIHRGGKNQYNMTGIAYFKKNDAIVLKNAVNESISQPGFENLYWDEVVDQILDRISVKVHPINGDELMEFDTIDELKQYDKFYENWMEYYEC